MNEQNLIPQAHKLTVEEASRGGKRSAESRRRKRDMAELAATMLNQRLAGASEQTVRNNYPDLDEPTVTALLLSGQINAAAKGNTKAAQFLSELSDREQERASKAQVYRMSPLDMTKDCIEPYRALHSFYDGSIALDDMVFKGGRGGIKSSFAAQLAYETMEQDDSANVVYGRRFATDLRHTVFTTFTRLLNEKGVIDEWEVTKSPMRCTRKSSGTAVYFFGFDNAEQLKSFTPEVGYVKLLIFEEADEMLGDEQMDSAADTFLRSNGFEGARQLRLKVFNPPPSKNNFMNEWVSTHAGDERVGIYHFDYRNVPVEWLGQVFLDRAERAKRERPEWYKNNYLGEVTGTGGELFANVSEETITDEQVKKWEDSGVVYQGLDFGYEHPMAFIRVAYDRKTDTLYPFYEHVKQRSSLVDFLKPLEGFKHQETIADSAEPDRIADMRDMDWDVVGAVKRWGNGRGRSYAWEWMRTRARIVVDPSRTPHLAKELRTLEFEKLKNGSYSSRLPDLNEDCVMATIYALNRRIMEGQ